MPKEAPTKPGGAELRWRRPPGRGWRREEFPPPLFEDCRSWGGNAARIAVPTAVVALFLLGCKCAAVLGRNFALQPIPRSPLAPSLVLIRPLVCVPNRVEAAAPRDDG